MKKVTLFILWIFLLLFSVATFYVSYSAYLYDRDKQVAENFSTFLFDYPEKYLVSLPYPEQTIVKVKRDGRIFASANFASPINLEDFVSSVKGGGVKNVEVYLRKASFGEYAFFLFANPLFLVMNIFLFVLYVAFFYYLLKELESPVLVKPATEKKATESPVHPELIKQLKALRVLLHTEKLLGQEASQKAKKLVDEMLKKLENK